MRRNETAWSANPTTPNRSHFADQSKQHRGKLRLVPCPANCPGYSPVSWTRIGNRSCGRWQAQVEIYFPWAPLKKARGRRRQRTLWRLGASIHLVKSPGLVAAQSTLLDHKIPHKCN